MNGLPNGPHNMLQDKMYNNDIPKEFSTFVPNLVL